MLSSSFVESVKSSRMTYLSQKIIISYSLWKSFCRMTKSRRAMRRRRPSRRSRPPWEARRGSAAAEISPRNRNYFLGGTQRPGLEPRHRRNRPPATRQLRPRKFSARCGQPKRNRPKFRSITRMATTTTTTTTTILIPVTIF